MSDRSGPPEPAPIPEDGIPFELELTPEQQAIIRRVSGKHAAALQLMIDAKDPSEGTGRSVQFRWRLSDASGIPRQVWNAEKKPETD
jgi:hypothetical protein